MVETDPYRDTKGTGAGLGLPSFTFLYRPTDDGRTRTITVEAVDNRAAKSRAAEQLDTKHGFGYWEWA